MKLHYSLSLLTYKCYTAITILKVIVAGSFITQINDRLAYGQMNIILNLILVNDLSTAFIYFNKSKIKIYIKPTCNAHRFKGRSTCKCIEWCTLARSMIFASIAQVEGY
jgi:hypothetical protein